MSMIYIKSYTEPPFSEREILRYAGVKAPDESINALLSECLNLTRGVFTYNICYCLTDVSARGSECDFGFFKVKSDSLAKNLSTSSRAVIFAATVGIGIDRLIAKYSRTSPARAHMLGAIGAERIEALCDAFENDIRDEYIGAKKRYSPGYGDTPIELQKDIFVLLDAPRKIGLSLTDSMLMSPTKSVTAIIGIA